MAVQNILTGREGERDLLLGNEAVVRGAFEAGVDIAATYPGTPASEIGDTFSALATSLAKEGKEPNFYFEWSTNEKVALDICIAACLSGLRTICPMKAMGLNVASDSLLDFMTMRNVDENAMKGGFVIVVGDDPSGWSSATEQDSRYFALMGDFPMLEPSNCQEMKDMTKRAFEISEELHLPILLRTVTRVNHQRGDVTFGKLGRPRMKGKGVKGPFVMNIPKAHSNILKKMQRAMELSEESEFNRIVKINGQKGDKRIGIVSSGVPIACAEDVAEDLGVETEILELGFTHPLPGKMCERFIGKFDVLAIVEDLEPILENQFIQIAYAMGAKTKILGKKTGHFTRVGEYTPEAVAEGLAKAFGKENPLPRKSGARLELPLRGLTFCPGCPHRATYYALKQSAPKDAIFPNDIGCYALGGVPPYDMNDVSFSMGASIGLACGFSRATEQPVIAIIGDSTFYHAGMPPLLNAVHLNCDITIVVMD
ncbi:MAG: thiamine pyrophosphate-dependent enzyme, partial [Chloroflexota bacterium]|nr:thiamine pyrophosphate-dependent enzyme [Chloroflexota bacterium]